MAVNKETPIIESKANGTAAAFPFAFRALTVNDVKVFVDGVELTTGFTIALNGDKGGTITFATAPAAGRDVMIRRDTEFKRETDYQTNGSLIADTLDDDFDRLWLCLQEEKAASDITLSKPVGAGAWNANKLQIENVADGVADTDAATVGQVKTFNGGAQNSMAAAQAAQKAAEAAQGAAYQSEQNAFVHANASQTSATASEASNKQSGTSASESAASADLARKWATNPVDAEVVTGGGQFSAYHWAQKMMGATAQAQQSATDAQNANLYASANADRAKTEADRAQTANPDNQLKKAQNLADLPDIAAARRNLGLGAIGIAGNSAPAGAFNSFASPDGTKQLVITNSGFWGVQDTNGVGQALPIERGGTAAITAAEAWKNVYAGASGPLTLKQDAASPYDAVTLRQLQAAGTGGGANQTGVMTNFLGAVEWFNGSRAKLPAGYVAADGQTLQRADYPELAEAVRSGFLANCTEAEWQNGAHNLGHFNRGKYSHGDTTTNFRVPDLNGMQTGSVKALFLRGSADYEVGGVSQDAAPALKGGSGNTYMTGAGNPGTNRDGPITSTVDAGGLWTPGGSAHFAQDTFDASQASPSYGRDGSQEVRPNSVVGIWIIRAKASFDAAKTSFRSVNGDASAPAAGINVLGGSLDSIYQVNGKDTVGASLTAFYKWNDPNVSAVIQARNFNSGSYANFYFTDAYTFYVNEHYRIDLANKTSRLPSLVVPAGLNNITVEAMRTDVNNYLSLATATGNPADGEYVGWVHGGWYQDWWTAGGCRGGGFNLKSYKIQVTNNTASGYWEFIHDGSGRIHTPVGDILPPVSDIRLKQNVTDAAAGALERIQKIACKDFEWKHDGHKDRGYIAQELQKVDPLYVVKSGGIDAGDDAILNVSQNAIISDLIGAVQTLAARVAELEAKG